MKKQIALILAVMTLIVLFSACGKKEETISLDSAELSLSVGESTQLSAGDAVKVHWSSSDETVATVSGGRVYARAAGTAVITASLENGASDECTVTVTEKLITAVKLNTVSARIEEGSTIQLSATYTPSDASVVKLSWESDNEAAATVDQNGYVTGISEGIATIICRSDTGAEATCIITVGSIALPTVPPIQPAATESPAETSAPKATAAPAEQTENSGANISDNGGFIFSDSSVRYLTADEIGARLSSMSGSPVSQSFVQDAVNEIFARHGYVFHTASIRAYYEAQSWYHADPNYDGSLNDVEQYNIVLLSQY